MTKKSFILSTFALAVLSLTPVVPGQDARIPINGPGGMPSLAVVDFRGSGAAQGLGSVFNGTLFTDLQTSGIFKMVPKSLYPLQNPQRPEDLRPSSGQGMALADWSGPPVNASHLVYGYAADQNGTYVLYGYVNDTRTPGSQPLLSKRYFGSMDEAGVRKVAHEFAADIIAQFGGASLAGSKIYFVSTRTGNKEIWSMDFDGTNQKQLTFNRSINIEPAISPDGNKLAFTSFAKGTPHIVIMDTSTGRVLPFYNQQASLNGSPSFSPDGTKIYYASSASGYAQIYVADIDGRNFRRISNARAVEVEPKVNPKSPNLLAFSSGRSGPEQIFEMNTDGTDVQRLTEGTGEASNPAWNPDGQHLLFAWTRGYAQGAFNIFLMDTATRHYDQLTSGAGRNENPAWAPDGRHLCFSSTRSGGSQIWSMLADGSQIQKLTTQGQNLSPVWSKSNLQ
jgi:TolB protein